MKIPKTGQTRDALTASMAEARQADTRWRDGRVWSLVYYAREDVLEVAKEAYLAFFSENGLGRIAFPSLQRFETEVVGMTASLLHGEQAVGSITSGGSESILMAVKTARDRARAERPRVQAPEIVLPVTAHPAFEKASRYFGLTSIRTPVGADFRADVAAMRAAVTDNTVLVVGSAPPWPHGVVDPIADIAAIAAERGISCHVDACLGGFVLPFARTLGYPIPAFDFEVPGVTSISADLHKYGYTAKGASVVLYRDPEVYKHQPFVYDWPGGQYATPTMAGTRPGGAIAAAWAVMQYLGETGYLELVDQAMKTTRALIDGIDAIDGLRVLGRPDVTVFAYASDRLDIYAVADGLAGLGWYVNRQSTPPSIHLKVDPMHAAVVDDYLADLARVTKRVAAGEIRSAATPVRYA
jgi:glutamate/tyrosine decarboxylase-like PLP-dependent enzyme